MGDVTKVILEVHDQGLHDLVDNARLTEIIQNAFLNVGLLKSRVNVKKWLFYKTRNYGPPGLLLVPAPWGNTP